MDEPIIVVGAGIGGLAFANACMRRHRSVTVLERNRKLEPVGAGIVIHPNGVAALEELGMADEVIARGTIIRKIAIHRRSDTIEIALEDVWAGAQRPSVGITRAALQDVMLSALGAAQPSLGVEVVGLRPSAEAVEIALADGRHMTARWVVAADGVHSRIRRSQARPLGLWYWRFCTRAPLVPPDEWHTWEQSEIDGLRLSWGYIPLGHGLTHAFVQCIDSGRHLADPDEARAFLYATGAERLSGMADALAHAAGPVHYGPALEVQDHVWQAERTAFLGDAAHALAPTLSEGASLALGDALALAALAGRHAPEQLPALLCAYERSRSARVAWAARMARHQVRTLGARARAAPPAPQAFASQYLRSMYEPLREECIEPSWRGL